jgi:hypothetical protein
MKKNFNKLIKLFKIASSGVNNPSILISRSRIIESLTNPKAAEPVKIPQTTVDN